MFTQTWSRRKDVSLRCSNLLVKTKKINQNKPDRLEKCRLSGSFEIRLVEADAGDVGGYDGVGMVVVCFREGYCEVPDLVCDAEFHQEDDEVAEVFDVVVIAFVGFDVPQEDDVVRKFGVKWSVFIVLDD